jgi:hypothetical protein
MDGGARQLPAMVDDSGGALAWLKWVAGMRQRCADYGGRRRGSHQWLKVVSAGGDGVARIMEDLRRWRWVDGGIGTLRGQCRGALCGRERGRKTK